MLLLHILDQLRLHRVNIVIYGREKKMTVVFGSLRGFDSLFVLVVRSFFLGLRVAVI